MGRRATPEERHELLAGMLDGVYVDLRGSRAVVGIKPKPPFLAVFEMATARDGSGVALPGGPVKPAERDQPPIDSSGAGTKECFWWRRGRVELPVQKDFRFDVHRLDRRLKVSPLTSHPGGLRQRPADES